MSHKSKQLARGYNNQSHKIVRLQVHFHTTYCLHSLVVAVLFLWPLLYCCPLVFCSFSLVGPFESVHHISFHMTEYALTQKTSTNCMRWHSTTQLSNTNTLPFDRFEMLTGLADNNINEGNRKAFVRTCVSQR